MSRVLSNRILEDRVQDIIKDASHVTFGMPADDYAVIAFTTIILNGLTTMKTKGHITDFNVHAELTPQNQINGFVSFTPPSAIASIKIHITQTSTAATTINKYANFDRAMRGV